MFPMNLGLLGAAMATAASPVCSILVCMTHFMGKKNTVVFKWHLPSFKMLKESCMLGTAAFVGGNASAVTTTVFNMLMLSLTEILELRHMELLLIMPISAQLYSMVYRRSTASDK